MFIRLRISSISRRRSSNALCVACAARVLGDDRHRSGLRTPRPGHSAVQRRPSLARGGGPPLDGRQQAASHGDCFSRRCPAPPLRRPLSGARELPESALYLLGKCALANGETADAVRALRYFVGGADARASTDYLPAKALLARALPKSRRHLRGPARGNRARRERRRKPRRPHWRRRCC